MELRVWFWLFYVLGLFLGLWWNRPPEGPYPWQRGGIHLLVWILFAIVGFKIFGSPIG